MEVNNMTDGQIYEGDVGVLLKVDTKVDLTAATGLYLKVQSPSMVGATMTWISTISPTCETMMEYTSVFGDMVSGQYLAHSFAEWSAASVHSGKVFKFKVLDVFK
jgi:hypothetical protein